MEKGKSTWKPLDKPKPLEKPAPMETPKPLNPPLDPEEMRERARNRRRKKGSNDADKKKRPARTGTPEQGGKGKISI